MAVSIVEWLVIVGYVVWLAHIAKWGRPPRELLPWGRAMGVGFAVAIVFALVSATQGVGQLPSGRPATKNSPIHARTTPRPIQPVVFGPKYPGS